MVRLGLSLPGHCTVPEMVELARRAEQIGFDTVLLPDHLGLTAPLPPLVAIAHAAPSVRVSNLVLNCAFYRPALLARDLASVDSATGGRLDVGLGAGYVEEEFTAAGLPFPTPGERIRLLTEHVTALRALVPDPGHTVAQAPPILIAAMGTRLLSTAGRHADIVAVASFGDEQDLAGRVEVVRSAAGPRMDDIQLAFSFFQVSLDDPDELSMLHLLAPGAPEAQLRSMATLLDGSTSAAAERIQRLQEELGISYFTFNNTPGTSWDTLEKLVATLR
jgi:probable F420-dependent oxidoreductase